MKPLVQRYRALLVAEESLPNLGRALDLVQEAGRVKVAWAEGEIKLHQLDEEERGPAVFGQRLSDEVRGCEWPEFQKARERRLRKRDRTKTQSLVLRTSFALALLPTVVRAMRPGLPRSRWSLFLDSLLVLFQQVYFALLPILRAEAWRLERATLLSAFLQFSRHLPRLADKYHVLALTYDATGDVDAAALHHVECLRATHADEHEFLTSLQSCWTFLIEHSRFREALVVLLDTYPRVPRAHLDELRELITATFDLQREFYSQASSGAA